MAIRMMSPLPARLIAVLQDYLPAELDLIDAEEGDFVMPDIQNANYHEWDRKLLPAFPACTIRPVSSRPNANDVREIFPDLHGRRASVRNRLDVMFHVHSGQSDGNPLMLQDLLFRYVTAAMRVLCIMHWELGTVADPTAFVKTTTWVGEATYGPEAEQETGAIVRTGTLPLEVWTIEARG